LFDTFAILKIYVPKGAHGYFLAGLDEEEMLFPHKTMFRLKSKKIVNLTCEQNNKKLCVSKFILT